MKREWHRAEARVLRPFVSTNACLANVRFRTHADSSFEDRDSFEIEETRLRAIKPEFHLKVDRSVDQIKSIAEENLSLVISLRDVRLRRTSVVLEAPLRDVPEHWSLPQPAISGFAWKYGVTATIGVILASDRPRKPAQPYLRGQWVDRKVFAVRPFREPHSFPIQKWPPERFVEHGLPRDSAYWLQLTTSDFNQAFDDPAEAFLLALRDDVYDALISSESAPSGRALEAVLLAEIITDVLQAGLLSVEPLQDLQRGGVLYGLTDKIRRTTGTQPQELFRIARDKEDGRSRLRAYVQSAFSTRRAISKLGRAEAQG